MLARKERSVSDKVASVLGKGGLGARVLVCLALFVVVVCCSENRTSIFGPQQHIIWRTYSGFGVQK